MNKAVSRLCAVAIIVFGCTTVVAGVLGPGWLTIVSGLLAVLFGTIVWGNESEAGWKDIDVVLFVRRRSRLRISSPLMPMSSLSDPPRCYEFGMEWEMDRAANRTHESPVFDMTVLIADRERALMASALTVSLAGYSIGSNGFAQTANDPSAPGLRMRPLRRGSSVAYSGSDLPLANRLPFETVELILRFALSNEIGRAEQAATLARYTRVSRIWLAVSRYLFSTSLLPIANHLPIEIMARILGFAPSDEAGAEKRSDAIGLVSRWWWAAYRNLERYGRTSPQSKVSPPIDRLPIEITAYILHLASSEDLSAERYPATLARYKLVSSRWSDVCRYLVWCHGWVNKAPIDTLPPEILQRVLDFALADEFGAEKRSAALARYALVRPSWATACIHLRPLRPASVGPRFLR